MHLALIYSFQLPTNKLLLSYFQSDKSWPYNAVKHQKVHFKVYGVANGICFIEHYLN